MEEGFFFFFLKASQLKGDRDSTVACLQSEIQMTEQPMSCCFSKVPCRVSSHLNALLPGKNAHSYLSSLIRNTARPVIKWQELLSNLIGPKRKGPELLGQ